MKAILVHITFIMLKYAFFRKCVFRAEDTEYEFVTAIMLHFNDSFNPLRS